MGTLMASCHVRHTSTQLITKVKQRWARLVLGWVTSVTGAVKRCTRILWPEKALEKTPTEVIPHLKVTYRRMPKEKRKNYNNRNPGGFSHGRI
jgi:hypothetical protein